MTGKTAIIEELGATAILLPELISRALGLDEAHAATASQVRGLSRRIAFLYRGQRSHERPRRLLQMNIDELASAIRRDSSQGKWLAVDSIIQKYNVERRDAVEVLKQLSMQGLGRFVPGRGFFPTRIEWDMLSQMKEGRRSLQQI